MRKLFVRFIHHSRTPRFDCYATVKPYHGLWFYCFTSLQAVVQDAWAQITGLA